MLEFKNVDFAYGEKQILKDFSFSAKEGEATAVLGPSGFGKTTLLNLAAGLLKPKSGAITPFECKKPSFVFQEDRLLPWFTALENITSVNTDEKAALEYLEKVGLEDSAKKLPSELSGGMLRRLAIARSFAFGGDLFFFDEPLRGLDVKTAEEILALIKTETRGKTVFLITHDPKEAFALCDRIIVAGGEPFEIKADRRRSDFSNEDELFNFLKEII